MVSAANDAAKQKKPPRVLRWIVALVLLWVITLGYYVIASEILFWSRLFGKGEVAADPVVQVELERGQPFGLGGPIGEYTTCQVVPENSEARELVAASSSSSSRRSSRLPRPEPAWFSGRAEIRCTGPTTVLLPERYDETETYVMSGLLGASGLMVLVVVVQLTRRVRFDTGMG